MRFLIFGGTGFVGSRMTTILREKGHDVLSISRSGDQGSMAVDITRESEFSKLKFQPDIVINAASQLPVKDKTSSDPEFVRALFLTNVVGAVNISNWAAKKNVKLLVNCSSLSVVKRPWPVPLSEEELKLPDGPHSAYGMSKLSQEQLMKESLRESRTTLVHLRISAVYGKGMTPDGIIFHLLDKLRDNRHISLTDAQKNTLDFIHVDDLCRSIYKISETAVRDEVVNVASGKPVTIMELAEILKDLTNSRSSIDSTVTENPSSEAVINIDRLKQYLGKDYRNFFSLKDGMSHMLRELDRMAVEPEKRFL